MIPVRLWYSSVCNGALYCPADQKVYIDTEFFKDMREQMEYLANKIRQNYRDKIRQGTLPKLMWLPMK
ncbi:neutral zinc metallopeptidase [Acinetobacter baumannii]